MKKAVIYARVSSEEQAKGYSIQAQIDACTPWAAQNGVQVVAVYEEPGRSARSANRPEFQRMVKNVLAGEADLILVHKLDRFARDRADSVVYKRMLRREGKDIISVTEPIDDGPAGVLMEGMLETIAEWYSANLSAEVIKGQVAKAKAGYWPGRRLPMGYRRVKNNGSTQIAISEMGAMITEAFTEFATGKYTLDTWRDEAYRRGYRGQRSGKKIAKSVWGRTFRNAFYAGVVVWRGRQYSGHHPPLIDKATFDRVQAVLDAHPGSGGERKQTRHFYLLRGLLTSTIHNKLMSGNPVRGGSGKLHYYYRATGNGPEHNIAAAKLEDDIVGILFGVRVVDLNELDAPERLVLALEVAPNLGIVYKALKTPQARRQLLELTFNRGAISVNENGIADVEVKPGLLFEFSRRGDRDSNPGWSFVTPQPLSRRPQSTTLASPQVN